MNEDYEILNKIADEECTCEESDYCRESGYCRSCIATETINHAAEILACTTHEMGEGR